VTPPATLVGRVRWEDLVTVMVLHIVHKKAEMGGSQKCIEGTQMMRHFSRPVCLLHHLFQLDLLRMSSTIRNEVEGYRRLLAQESVFSAVRMSGSDDWRRSRLQPSVRELGVALYHKQDMVVMGYGRLL
jgi:hypothetical protein